MGRAASLVVRTVEATRLLARDARVPRPLRWVAAVGILPLPGPADEAILLLIAPVFVLFYRAAMRDAWEQAGAPRSGSPLGW